MKINLEVALPTVRCTICSCDDGVLPLQERICARSDQILGSHRGAGMGRSIGWLDKERARIIPVARPRMTPEENLTQRDATPALALSQF
jgi:hypothetical protein